MKVNRWALIIHSRTIVHILFPHSQLIVFVGSLPRRSLFHQCARYQEEHYTVNKMFTVGTRCLVFIAVETSTVNTVLRLLICNSTIIIILKMQTNWNEFWRYH